MILDYSICVGLYAYLRQLALSFDRALPKDIEGIRNYFSSTNNYNPRYVARYFECIAQSNQVKSNYIFIDYKKGSLMSRIFLKNKLIIKSDDLLAIVYSIFRAAELINEDHLDSEACVSLRMFLYSMNERVLGSKLKKKYRIDADRVEHYNQNFNLTLKSIDTILNRKWLG